MSLRPSTHFSAPSDMPMWTSRAFRKPRSGRAPATASARPGAPNAKHPRSNTSNQNLVSHPPFRQAASFHDRRPVRPATPPDSDEPPIWRSELGEQGGERGRRAGSTRGAKHGDRGRQARRSEPGTGTRASQRSEGRASRERAAKRSGARSGATARTEAGTYGGDGEGPARFALHPRRSALCGSPTVSAEVRRPGATWSGPRARRWSRLRPPRGRVATLCANIAPCPPALAKFTRASSPSPDGAGASSTVSLWWRRTLDRLLHEGGEE
jgi:hypothetical protein